jgi:hypothetical protein
MIEKIKFEKLFGVERIESMMKEMIMGGEKKDGRINKNTN